MDEDAIYKRIGEFVVCFQFVENQLRQIGQFILDPARNAWPRKRLRKKTSKNLADNVARLYDEAIHLCGLQASEENEFRDDFHNLIRKFHELRRARNRFIHSAYIELKADGEIQALLRSNSQTEPNPMSGEEERDQEILLPEPFQKEFETMGQLAFRLRRHYLQLIHRLSRHEEPTATMNPDSFDVSDADLPFRKLLTDK